MQRRGFIKGMLGIAGGVLAGGVLAAKGDEPQKVVITVQSDSAHIVKAVKQDYKRCDDMSLLFKFKG